MRPVALAGRVPVKVTTENGDIEVGDYLVPASKPGYAMKACGTKYCKSGMVIGKALERFGTSQSGDTEDVRTEILTSSEEIKEKIEDMASTALDEDKEKLEDIQEVAEKLIKEDDSKETGEGRIMMFVKLEYRLGQNILDKLNTEEESKGDSHFSGNTLKVEEIITIGIITGSIDTKTITVKDISVEGLLKSKKIKTSLIEALDDTGITMKLMDNQGLTSFQILNGLGNKVFGVNSNSTIEIFGGLSLAFSIDNRISGTDNIPNGDTITRVFSNVIKSSSTVLLSITDNSIEEFPLVKLNRVEKGYFEVQIDKLRNVPTFFDWFVIN
jgi:hypothetical protein